MRSFVTCTVLASVASMAAAQLGHPLFEYPAAVPVEKRQEPGTPRYQCHEDCGLLITLGREDGYCSNTEWTDRYARCMVCANEFGIWMYYSNGVTSAAAECGLTPVPSPSGGAASTTAAAPTTAAPVPTTAAPVTTETPEEPAVSTTAAAEETSAPAASSSSAAAAATTLSTQASASASGAATTGTAAGSSAASTTATRVTSIGTSVVIPSGTPTSTIVFAGAGKNAAAMGVTFFGMLLAAF
ncbi:hypothetical protein EsH8_III_001002 [Colletotrichum jinshuiense]